MKSKKKKKSERKSAKSRLKKKTNYMLVPGLFFLYRNRLKVIFNKIF